VEKRAHDEIVQLVERMLALQQRLAAARTPGDQQLAQGQIAMVDGILRMRHPQDAWEIDRRVYALYGLTEEEIAVVEG
jgi:hypothetical protein